MTMALRWDPTLDTRLDARRRPGRPKTRWSDDICHHVQRTTTTTPQPTLERDSNNDDDNSDDNNNNNGDDPVRNITLRIGSEQWIAIASDARRWAELEQGFVNDAR